MNLLLDFVEDEFGLLPVESPGESIVFIPQFVAIVGTALRDTSVWVSLFGLEEEFDGHDTEPGKYQNWRRYHVQNRSDDIVRAKALIRQACQNYIRNQCCSDLDELIMAAEQRWIKKRNQERREAERQRILREI